MLKTCKRLKYIYFRNNKITTVDYDFLILSPKVTVMNLPHTV